MRKQFANEPENNQEFLSASYFRYFNGRPYTDSLCYLTITQEAKKSRLFSYDSKKWRDFLVKIYKVRDLLRDSGVPSEIPEQSRGKRICGPLLCDELQRPYGLDDECQG